jgi:hypothetical protein
MKYKKVDNLPAAQKEAIQATIAFLFLIKDTSPFSACQPGKV